MKNYKNPFLKKTSTDKSLIIKNQNLKDAIKYHQNGQLEHAELKYRQVLKFDPRNADALQLIGVVAYQTGRYTSAIDLINEAININPHVASYYSNLGIVLKEINESDEAIINYNKAISLKPDYAEAYYNRGISQQELKQIESAITSYDMAIALKPDYADAYYNRGNALQILKKLEGAIENYDKAITINPYYAAAYSNRGVALEGLNKIDIAIENYDKAIELKSDYAEAYSNRGNALQELGRLDEAAASYDKALELKPDYAEANFNKSLLLLLSCNFGKGWESYEWRWYEKDIRKFKRDFSQPIWLGVEALLDKTILIHAEQGLGDTLQFCRYVKMVADLGAKVIFEVQKPLVKLLEDLPGVSTLIARGDPLPEFDYHCPLMSLPLAFKTELKSIPFAERYLKADPKRVDYWREYLKKDSFKIGIGWQGSQGTKIDIGRSFDLKLFQLIAEIRNVQLVSLQKGYGSEQLNNMPEGMQVTELGEQFDTEGAFLDTAAVMMNLDLVITSDTALAHLAGALGVKTWVALKYVPDWRWMLGREDSPWYPSLTLYRQPKHGEWVPIFDQIKMDITNLLSNKGVIS
jgi:tetratricopeptide (TPR) repeat protein